MSATTGDLSMYDLLLLNFALSMKKEISFISLCLGLPETLLKWFARIISFDFNVKKKKSLSANTEVVAKKKAFAI